MVHVHTERERQTDRVCVCGGERKRKRGGERKGGRGMEKLRIHSHFNLTSLPSALFVTENISQENK